MEIYYWILSALLIFISTAISSWLTPKNIFIRCLVPSLIAVLAFFFTPLIDSFVEKISEPYVKVSSQLLAKEGVIEIGIQITKNSVNSATLDFPLNGVIRKFEDLNPVVEVIAKRIGENDLDGINHLRLNIEKIEPKTNLKYRIYYRPQPGHPVPGTNRYKFSYSWSYRDKFKNKSIWQWSFNDKKATPPPKFHGEPVNLNMEIPNDVIKIEMMDWYKRKVRERRLN